MILIQVWRRMYMGNDYMVNELLEVLDWDCDDWDSTLIFLVITWCFVLLNKRTQILDNYISAYCPSRPPLLEKAAPDRRWRNRCSQCRCLKEVFSSEWFFDKNKMLRKIYERDRELLTACHIMPVMSTISGTGQSNCLVIPSLILNITVKCC